MSGSDYLQPLQFQYSQPGPGAHKVEAYHEGEHVGNMRWDSKNGEILELRTRPDVRRRGVATGMFQYGQQYEPAPRHSSSRSPEGDRFAKSTGTSVPKLRKKIPSESSLDLSHEEAMRMAKD